MKLDHISYAVRSTDKAIKAFIFLCPKILVYKCLEKNQNVYITYLTDEDEKFKIELVESAGKPNPLENLLKSKNSILYHLCYRVRNFKKAINYFKKKSFLMITKPFETAYEKDVFACHFFNPQCGVIEIMGKK